MTNCWTVRNGRLRRKLRPYLFLLPMLVFAVGFVYYPFLKTFLYSFHTVNARGEMGRFVWFENFSYLFSRREFSAALSNTLKLTCLNVPITLVLTILMALLCERPRRRLNPILETLFSLPMAVAMSAIALIFKVLLNPTVGYVNYLLGLNVGWFQDRDTALYGILLLTVWMGLGFNFLLFRAALRAVPAPLLESAELDGAGKIIRFFRIQLPQIAPTILYVVCTNTVLALMTSGPVMLLTKGGPMRSTTTMIYMMYTSGYQSSNYSMAACISIITFLMAFAFTAVTFALDERRDRA